MNLNPDALDCLAEIIGDSDISVIEDFPQTEYEEMYTNLAELHRELLIAFHEAINRPKGVVPKCGDKFYNHKYYDGTESYE